MKTTSQPCQWMGNDDLKDDGSSKLLSVQIGLRIRHDE